MVRVLDSQALVLPANKNGREQVAAHEEEQEEQVQVLVAVRVKDAQANKADGADDGEEDCEAIQNLLANGGVGYEAALVAEPAVGEEGEVEEDGGEDAAGDEEGLEVVGADVADVGDALGRRHGGVDCAVGVDDPVEEHAEEHAEPHETRYDGEDPV